MSTAARTHTFGGGWTEIKLAVVEKYLQFYTLALSKQAFELVYIDAFAGNGRCELKEENGEIRIVDGSALRALNTQPAFTELHFIEKDAQRAADLQLAVEHDPRAHVYTGDCCVLLDQVLPKALRSKSRNYQRRGVIFLDPYGMAVDFDMLKRISATQALDVWYLFPLSAALRQMSLDKSRIDEHKQASLRRILGDADWERLYTAHPQMSLLDPEPQLRRQSGDSALLEVALEQLRTAFPYVHKDVLRLPSQPPHFFALIFACSNPSPKAIGLAQNPLKYILRAQQQA